ncbi:hypothetical protein MBLNU457_7141t1 [Dothideomycetes sp. NU457]
MVMNQPRPPPTGGEPDPKRARTEERNYRGRLAAGLIVDGPRWVDIPPNSFVETLANTSVDNAPDKQSVGQTLGATPEEDSNIQEMIRALRAAAGRIENGCKPHGDSDDDVRFFSRCKFVAKRDISDTPDNEEIIRALRAAADWLKNGCKPEDSVRLWRCEAVAFPARYEDQTFREPTSLRTTPRFFKPKQAPSGDEPVPRLPWNATVLEYFQYKDDMLRHQGKPTMADYGVPIKYPEGK